MPRRFSQVGLVSTFPYGHHLSLVGGDSRTPVRPYGCTGADQPRWSCLEPEYDLAPGVANQDDFHVPGWFPTASERTLKLRRLPCAGFRDPRSVTGRLNGPTQPAQGNNYISFHGEAFLRKIVFINGRLRHRQHPSPGSSNSPPIEYLNHIYTI